MYFYLYDIDKIMEPFKHFTNQHEKTANKIIRRHSWQLIIMLQIATFRCDQASSGKEICINGAVSGGCVLGIMAGRFR